MLNATLVKKIPVTDSLLIYRVLPDQGIPNFLPGQYVALGLMPESPRPAHLPAETTAPKPERLLKRTYSIGSSPIQKDFFEFYLAIVPEGSLSPRLSLLEEGNRLYCADKVTGKFTLEAVPAGSDLVFVATGTGLAPFLSMLRTPSTWDHVGAIKLVYGVRYAEDIAYLDELESIKISNPRFSFEITVSRPNSNWTGHRGYVQHLLENKNVLLDPAKDHLMLCGNPGMIDDVLKCVSALGFVENTRKQAGNIHLERYW